MLKLFDNYIYSRRLRVRALLAASRSKLLNAGGRCIRVVSIRELRSPLIRPLSPSVIDI